MAISYEVKSFNGFRVYYTIDLNGGGLYFADDFLEVLRKYVKIEKFERAFEWCSGPGFIGYAAFANKICKSLVLSDFYGPAVSAARYTAKMNGVEDKVNIYQGDNINFLPEYEVFDLVLGNPPHFPERNMLEFTKGHDPRIYVDEGWHIHRDFFGKIRGHLSQNGLIVICENIQGSHLETFRKMLEPNRLKLAGWQRSPIIKDLLWYMFIARDDSTVKYDFG